MTMTRTFRLLAAAATLLALATPAFAAAPPQQPPVEIDVSGGQVQPLPIAVPAFAGADARTSQLGGQIARVMAADLERSGFFRPLPQASFPQATLDIAVQPDLTAWRGAGAQALVNGLTTIDADGRLRVDFRLWDVGSGASAGGQGQLLGVQFTSTPENWRRMAHKVADAVYKQLTGEDGYFDTRIVFVAESGTKAQRTKRLAIMDQDGANPSFLTDGTDQVLTPRFSGTSQEITYMTLGADKARVHLFNIETGRHETLGEFTGMVFAPRFSPDGTKVAFSVQKDGNSDIYVMDLRSRESKRLTTDPSIDTSPSFSPDGTKVVFNSDRGGSPQLYIMNANGSGQKRVSFGKGRYTTPVWSPKGDWIAFTRQEGSTFHIGVMHPNGSEERTLTSAGLDEGPTWAPNGRVLMFAREGGGSSRLWTVDITGRVSRAAEYRAAATDPAWSPLLK
ncbi:Tol-Pal system beta propeller repeat protein TolB [soil metagenome]